MGTSESEIQSTLTAITVISQVADLCRLLVPGRVIKKDKSFSIARTDNEEGILSVLGVLSEDTIRLYIEILKNNREAKAPLNLVLNEIAELSDMTKLVTTTPVGDDSSYWLMLPIKAAPVSYVRSTALSNELAKINKLAKILQSSVASSCKYENIEKEYAPFKGSLRPIYPWVPHNDTDAAALLKWANDVYEVLWGSCSVAVSCSHSTGLDLGMAVIAQVMRDSNGRTLGATTVPAVSSKSLVDMAAGAPGYLTINATSISLGTNIYEMGNEVRSTLSTLAHMDRPIIFGGSYSELQSLFHGGQGGDVTPLSPVLFHFPDVSLDTLCHSAVHSETNRTDGISSPTEHDLAMELRSVLEQLSPGDRERVLPAAARRIVKLWTNSRSTGSISSYVSKISNFSETLSGLSPSPRAVRSRGVQERFVRILTDRDLLPFLKQHLYAQDEALSELVSRLSMECLTRPMHQPLRYCAQGTPGTGKSESAALLAECLGVPLVHIDAASIPDYYTAAAQLLGSGRGIVGSYQSGRLEQAAKHHAGVVIEISDLDHANPSTRSALADLFLQVLEVGEVTSASGATFSCANAIFAFTMNLPNGMDESVRRTIGFGNTSSRAGITRKIGSEIKDMLSSAFLSRVGTPIVFEPLSSEAFGKIIEQTIEASLQAATERLGLHITSIEIPPNLGVSILGFLNSSLTSYGARLILEQGRMKAGEALLSLHQSGVLLDGKVLVVSHKCGELSITARNPTVS
jgi:hypothetical protein